MFAYCLTLVATNKALIGVYEKLSFTELEPVTNQNINCDICLKFEPVVYEALLSRNSIFLDLLVVSIYNLKLEDTT